MSNILIDISASNEWNKEEVSLVKKILLFSFNSLSDEKCIEISVRLTGDKEIKSLNRINNTILFSPGAASFDQFKNFESRGNEFKRLSRLYAKKFI